MNRPDSSNAPLVCAYLINQYPKVSHSFVRREIRALESRGVTVQRFAVRGWDEAPVDPQDRDELSKTRYLLQGGLWPLLLSGLTSLLTQPGRFTHALKACWRMSRGADRGLPYHLVYLLEATLLASWLRQGNVTHVHAHFGTNSAETAVLAALLADCRCSFTVHGPEEFDKPQALHLKAKVAHSDFVVAISSYGRSQLYRWLDHRDWPKVHVVHCGLDEAFVAGEFEPVSSPHTLLCIGRLCEQKGQLLLVEAAAELKRQGFEFQLVLAGDGDMRPEIEALVSKHGLRDTVRITGWISGAQVREELLGARAMILPSFAEGLPVVIMEAMAMKRPVLSTYVAGIPELVLNEQTGWLFPAGDVAAMVEAMEKCLQLPPSELQAMGEAARQRVLSRHDVAKSARILHEAMLSCRDGVSH
jgi:colanic acid/amylovoran biosynthesis glycosyltransferase